MSIQKITPDDWLLQSWKNGQGLTNQIALENDPEGMLWRLSIAEVSQSGAFSVYPHYERVIVLLDGAGFKLTFADNRKHTLWHKYQLFNFSGDEIIDCELLGTSSRDFNLMLRRNNLKAQFKILTLAKFTNQYQPLSLRTIIFVAHGEITIRLARLEFKLSTEQSLIFYHEEGNLEIINNLADSTLFIIEMN